MIKNINTNRWTFTIILIFILVSTIILIPVSSTAELVNTEIAIDMSENSAGTEESAEKYSLFLDSFIIIAREGFEAIIIIGALAAYLLASKNEDKLKYLYLGGLIAIIASVGTAVLIKTVFTLSGADQEALEGLTMLIAVVVLFYVSFWLISKIQAEKWKKFIEGKLKGAISKGSMLTLSLVSFLVVYREGFETVLFYQALSGSAEGAAAASMIPLGFILGSIVLAAIFILFYKYSVKIPVKQFFILTSIILFYMAFTFLGKGIHELQEAGWISMTSIAAPTIKTIGVYGTVETLLAQTVLIAIILFSALWVINPFKKGQSSDTCISES